MAACFLVVAAFLLDVKVRYQTLQRFLAVALYLLQNPEILVNVFV